MRGSLQAPPSKSFAQRAVAAAALAGGRSVIMYPGDSDDVRVALNVVRQFGAHTEVSEDKVAITGGLSVPSAPLDCGEAGLSIRMFSAIAALLDQSVILTGRGSLLKRPMKVIEESLRAAGAECTTSNGFVPVKVRGPLPGGTARIDGSLSSQVVTGILMAAPMALNDMTLLVDNLQSRPYVDITLSVMESFGVLADNNNYSEFFVKSGQSYKPCRYEVEGDWSGSAFLLVAGAIAGEVTVTNLRTGSPQADRAIMEVLEKAGASFTLSGKEIKVTKSRLRPFVFDAGHCPDLFPPLVSLAAYCGGESIIAGAGRLIHKESNRAETLREEFGKLGISVEYDGDVMRVKGGQVKGGVVHSRGDHRIAMACAVAALAGSADVEIGEAEAVAKSYPRFFDDLKTIS